MGYETYKVFCYDNRVFSFSPSLSFCETMWPLATMITICYDTEIELAAVFLFYTQVIC